MKTFNEFIEELKNNGFKVYTSDDKTEITYCFFVKDNKIGYMETDYFGRFRLSTVHKPSNENGTGFNVYNDIINPTINHAEDCLVIAPRWAEKRKQYGRNATNNPVIKYNNWDEYINSSLGSILKYREI